MKSIKAEHRSTAEFAMTKFWHRKDVMVVAAGSLPCIRELYVLAKAMDKLHQLRYVKMANEDYILGIAEEKIRDALTKAAQVPGVQVVVFYLSCMDILIRLDFQDLEASISKETGKWVRCFYRGPLGKAEEDHEDWDTFMSHFPEEKGAVTREGIQLPPPVSDGAGVSDWLRLPGFGNILVNPAGCRSCMADLDMTEDQDHVYYPDMKQADFVFGLEDTTEKQTNELLDGGNISKAALISTAVPAFMGMDGEMVAAGIRGRGHETLFFGTDGFHDAAYGVSRAELKLAKLRASRGKREKGKTVQVLGYSPLLCGDRSQYADCIAHLESLGYEVRFDGLEEISQMPALNWCVSAAGIPAGRWMEQVLGVPLLISTPVGDHAFASWQKQTAELLAEGKGERVLKIHNMGLPHTREERVLFLGDPVQTMAAAHFLWHRGFSHITLGDMVWTRETEQLFRSAPGCEHMKLFHTAEELREAGQEADIIFADPWFFSYFPGKNRIALPWGVFSGRDGCGAESGILGERMREELEAL